MKAVFVLVLLIFFSCGSKTAVPDGVIPVGPMTGLMWDMMLADGLVTHRYPTLADSAKLDTSAVLYQQIAKAHNTTQQQFKESLRFYQGRPDLLQLIIDSLQRRSLVPLQALKKDSAEKKSKPFKKQVAPIVP